jgi:predicted metal-dependent phosphotriesterase family hydrolase
VFPSISRGSSIFVGNSDVGRRWVKLCRVSSSIDKRKVNATGYYVSIRHEAQVQYPPIVACAQAKSGQVAVLVTRLCQAILR